MYMYMYHKHTETSEQWANLGAARTIVYCREVVPTSENVHCIQRLLHTRVRACLICMHAGLPYSMTQQKSQNNRRSKIHVNAHSTNIVTNLLCN